MKFSSYFFCYLYIFIGIVNADERWDAFVSNAEEDERKETWVTIDQLLNRKLAPTRPPQKKLDNNLKTKWRKN